MQDQNQDSIWKTNTNTKQQDQVEDRERVFFRKTKAKTLYINQDCNNLLLSPVICINLHTANIV